MMIAAFCPILGAFQLTAEMLVIFVFATVLPVGFLIWLRAWLGSVPEENPDDVIREQAKADKEHHEHHGGGDPHSHDRDRGDTKHRAHA